MTVWLQLAVCAAVITYSGVRLCKYGDVIAEKTGVGRTWIGMVMMASVTSLPELITGVSSVAVHNLPNIAAGDVLGSCMFNMLIIALLDLRCGKNTITGQATQSQLLSAALGVFLLALAGVAIIAQHSLPAIGWVGIWSPVMLLLYLLSMRLIYKKTKTEAPSQETDQRHQKFTLRRAVVLYSINALVVVAAATWLPQLGEKIAEMTGLGQTFVGSLFIAASTSLPELVVCFSAVAIGAPNLALGNLFGSNLFNLAVLAIDDVLYVKGPLLSSITGNHAISAGGAIALTAIAMVSMVYSRSKKRFALSSASLAMILVFVAVSWMVYRTR